MGETSNYIFLVNDSHPDPDNYLQRYFSDLLYAQEGFLDKVRERLIVSTFGISAAVCLVFVILRLVEWRLDTFIIASIGLVMSLFWMSISRKGYGQISIVLASFVFLLMAFYEGLTIGLGLGIPFPTFCYFSLVPAIFSVLIRYEVVRVIILASYTLTFLLLAYLTEAETLVNVLIWLGITIFSLAILIFFIRLMENQESEMLKAIEDKNLALEKLEKKHEEMVVFNNMMNHDIKAPLRSIKGFTTLLQRKTNPTNTQKQYLDFIAGSTENLETLISNLLILSKASSTNSTRTLVSLNDLIDKITKDLSFDIQKSGACIQVEPLPQIYGFPEGLKTVFLNLLTNSIKYQPLTEGHRPEIHISHRHEAGKELIYIQDNGIGIEEKYLEKLFTPFIRSPQVLEYEGTGLGMVICKKIMDNHQGDISYEKNELPGTCILLTFPTFK